MAARLFAIGFETFLVFKSRSCPMANAASTGRLQQLVTSNGLRQATQRVKAGVERLLGYFSLTLICIDVVTSNWQLINFIGNGNHFLTPILNVNSTHELERMFMFPLDSSIHTASQVGLFQLQTTIEQAQSSSAYVLDVGVYDLAKAPFDFCNKLVQSYPVGDKPVGSTMRLATLLDGITYIRGDTISHWFGDTKTAPEASPGMNDTQIRAMGYIPGRTDTDLRVTTPLSIPPPGQSRVVNLTMYRFYAKAFCSGCESVAELGKDPCTLEYSYDDKAKQLVVAKASHSSADKWHDVGLMINHPDGAIVSLWIRGVSVLLVLGAFRASQKTVQWVDSAQAPLYKKLLHIVAPPLDIFVVLYTLAILADESTSMYFSRVINYYYRYSRFGLFTELRLMAISFRWLWPNCFVVKLLKWTAHFVASTQHTGESVVMPLFNFSSVVWVYLGLLGLFERMSFIEYANSVTHLLPSNVQSLDGIAVDYFQSWYIRTVPSVSIAVVINVVLVLMADHVWNRQWWSKVRRNSLGRQLMYNSTSILCDLECRVVDRPDYAGTCVAVKARALGTLRWFMTSHLTNFGLSEHPQVMRELATSKAKSQATSKVNLKKPTTDKLGETRMPDGDQPLEGPTKVAPSSDVPAVVSANDINLAVQDRDGYLHIVDSQKRDMAALGYEVKVLHDTDILIG
ncbi:hypothetical protein Ae201684P_017215 [Aphanomyces euteiches]|uniref:Uncharacterized protein n=1 Tax=Aphanomyces euteiches TaxID=100861 RepID=A0A6G0WC28_9STRA|nr:hypothetical protein Ae201684_017397 [Aphanomyces euteiches]KAH9088606.1 hypothetical protein Ae201684P_017215 [Aphanomyces euteiches]